MMMQSINPYNNELLQEYSQHTTGDIHKIIQQTQNDWLQWRELSFQERAEFMLKTADVLEERKDELARLITLEMGKLINESKLEIDKCIKLSRFYATNTEKFLAPEIIQTDALKSYVNFEPLGIVLGVMPWNYPFWQVWRYAVPALMAGNACVLKHASNVSGSALMLEKIFQQAGLPSNIFRTLLITGAKVSEVLHHPYIKAVALTGSEDAGSVVAKTAGSLLKKVVLELGGSDPFVVLEDADLDKCVPISIKARFNNMGQTCISAKRFIVMESIVEEFIERQKAILETFVYGDPLDENIQIAPLSRKDIVIDIDQQVQASIKQGAKLITGAQTLGSLGNFYAPTILTNIKRGMPVYNEETFGPVSTIISVKSEAEALTIANDTPYGLGGAVWTKDLEKGEKFAKKLEAGITCVNSMVRSDIRMPFGGVKMSGFGRELSSYGIKEFVNIQSLYIME